jgi:hypothetical protein
MNHWEPGGLGSKSWGFSLHLYHISEGLVE